MSDDIRNASTYAAALRGDLASSGAGRGSDLIAFQDQVAPGYLKTLSDIASGMPVSVTRFIPRTQYNKFTNGVYDGTSGIAEAMSATKRLFFPTGLFRVTAPIVFSDHEIDGAGRQGGSPPQGTVLQVEGNHQCFKYHLDNCELAYTGASAF